MSIGGHYEEIDGYWCFVEVLRGEKIIYDKVPMEQHLRELAKAKKQLHDLVTMDCKDFVRCYGR